MSPDEFPEMISREEGKSLLPYYDSAGNPTIGIGINLADSSNLSLVLQAVFNGNVPTTALSDFEAVLGTNYDTDQALQNALDTQLGAYSNAPSQFELTSAEETSIFTTVAGQKVTALNNILSANGTPLDNNSPEFMALLSLYYNQQTSNPPIGLQLLHALAEGNRAQAWYQIRYQSDANDPDGGIEKRRLYESQVFGLDGSASSLAQAEQDYEMLTEHRGTIIGKEASTVTQNGTSVSVGVDPDAPAPDNDLIDEANSDYNLTPTVAGGTSVAPVNTAVQSLAQTFNPEADQIISYLQSTYGAIVGDIVNASEGESGGFAVKSTDIFVAPSAADIADGFATAKQEDVNAGAGDGAIPGGTAEAAANHIVIGMTTGDILTGGLGNDIIVAGSGNETLNAGLGSDTLIGGAGNDVLVGGAGTDVFDLDFTKNPNATGAVEAIVDNTGVGALDVDGLQVGSGSLTASAPLTWSNAAYTYTFVPASKIPPAEFQALGVSNSAWGPGVGEMEITPTASGGGAVGTIDIFGFNLAQAATIGFLGIHIPVTLSLTAGATAGVDPPAPDFTAGSTQSYTVSLDIPSTSAQTVTVTLSGASAADFEALIGSTVAPLNSNGTFTFTLAARQTSAAFSLVNTADVGQNASLQLVASVANPSDPAGKAITSTLTQNFVETSPDPFLNNGGSSVTGESKTENTTGFQYTLYQGGFDAGQAEQMVLTGADNYVTEAGENDFITVAAPGKNNIIIGSGAVSSNTILLNGASDVANAIALATAGGAGSGKLGDAVATGAGNDTVVGGEGNSVYLVGAGDNVIYTGAGNDIVSTGDDVSIGIESAADKFDWSMSVKEIHEERFRPLTRNCAVVICEGSAHRGGGAKCCVG